MVSRQENIAKSTIKGWVDKEKSQEKENNNAKSSTQPTSEEKFHIVMETFPLNEAELAEYARKQGLFLADIEEWQKIAPVPKKRKV